METNGRQISEAEQRKYEAEAVKFSAEAEAMLIEARANERKALAEAGKLEAEGRKAAFDADDAQIYHLRRRREEDETLASNKYHYIYHYTSEISDASVKTCMDQLDVWRRNDNGSKHPIQIIFTSPGGSILAGLVLYDYLQMLRKDGYQIITGTFGMAASMAGILLQAGDVRWIGREAWVLIHQASFGAGGKMGDVEDTVAWVKRIQERILDIFANRAAACTKSNVKSIRNKIKKAWMRRDWWLSSDECLKYGFVDEIR